ncbi:MAG: sulfatase-like hydrolase/transferase, partial [Fibrobacteraceae bacterium]|nr:sulfatase-like hydrolase/transferase [Fibrobacteraceae bacterium]
IFTYVDHEVERFMGSHLTFALFDAYRDPSLIAMFPSYVALDASIPYLQFFVVPFLFLLVFLAAWGVGKLFSKVGSWKGWALTALSLLVVYIASELFLNAVWTGAERMRKLAPVVSVIYKEWQMKRAESALSYETLKACINTSRKFWAEIEGEDSSIWTYPDSLYPLYRIPKEGFETDSLLSSRRAKRPNFLVIFLESWRGYDVGYLNPDDPRESATPVLDSLAETGEAWMRMYVSGASTVEGLLSAHVGFPPHRTRMLATELSTIDVPSFASMLRDSGYVAEFFSALDPAGDNLSVWFRKWYGRTHYSENWKGDSAFFRASASFICDSLAKKGKPFLAGLISQGSRYPFSFAPGIPDFVKKLSPPERLRYAMHCADLQLGAFLHRVSKEPWFANTYVIVLGDHGFSQGGHGFWGTNAGGYSDLTWIPFVIVGPGLSLGREHFTVSSESDIAPTIISLAGLRVPNSFMGHDLLRPSPSSFAIGVHTGIEALSVDGYRLLTGLPGSVREGGDVIFSEEDVRELFSLMPVASDKAEELKLLADSLLLVNDYTLSSNRVRKSH